MKKKYLYLFIPQIAVLLMAALPNSVAMRFAPEPVETIIHYTNYYDLLPFGYGHFGPFLTVCLAGIVLLLTIIWFFTQKQGILSSIRIVSVFELATSMLPLALGLSYITWIGVVITLIIVIQVVLFKLELVVD
ncbi:hypothetical protein JV173_00095 [Acholeplasma equirhinis]|uniref:hypothetical protein n=1 Tax=Acholeplasma equirhinis TaxID=555393 RepID=UPI00197AB3D6|nr:hypothetical protein [Acholeplasma equirhinis]MBN3489902.1 hypothetical protein [Acholeplasma equirhinis]